MGEFLIFLGFARSALRTTRKSASWLRPLLRQSTGRCIPGTTSTRITPTLAGMCAVLCRAQRAAMAPGAWAHSERLAQCWKANQRQTAMRIPSRAIYVLDPASRPNQNEVVLYVYTKVDTITTDSDTVTVTLSQTISLPLVGDPVSSGALPFMAANQQFLFLGTDQSPQAVELDKRSFSITQLGGFTPPINVFAILANQYGYATLSFGNFRGGGNKAFIVAGPDEIGRAHV